MVQRLLDRSKPGVDRPATSMCDATVVEMVHANACVMLTNDVKTPRLRLLQNLLIVH